MYIDNKERLHNAVYLCIELIPCHRSQLQEWKFLLPSFNYYCTHSNYIIIMYLASVLELNEHTPIDH